MICSSIDAFILKIGRDCIAIAFRTGHALISGLEDQEPMTDAPTVDDSCDSPTGFVLVSYFICFLLVKLENEVGNVLPSMFCSIFNIPDLTQKT